MPQLIPITAQQAQQYGQIEQNFGAGFAQPAAQLGLTQQETSTSGQSAATSATEQQSIQTQIPGQAAESGIKQVQQQAANYPLELQKDLSSGITLKNAINKYSPLMKPDDIFNQYLAHSTQPGAYGLPKESAAELNAMGVSTSALGQPGQQNTFADRASTRGAIEELNKLQNLWNSTSDGERMRGIVGLSDQVRAYNQQRDYINAHYPSLLTAPNTQGTGEKISNDLPDITDLRIGDSSANELINNAKNNLLLQKQYTTKDVGLTESELMNSKSSNEKPSNGGGLLSGLLKTAENVPGDAANIINGILGAPANVMKSVQQTAAQDEAQHKDVLTDLSQKYSPNSLMANSVFGYAGNLNKDLGSPLQGGDIVGRMGQNFQNRPVSTILDALPFLAEGKASLLSKGGDVGEGASTVNPATDLKSPNALTKMLNPNSIKSTFGNIRDGMVTQAVKAGNIIDGSDLFKKIESWGNGAGKMGNIGQGGAIQSAIDDAKQLFDGKKVDPQTLYNAYKEADNGYSANGIPKSPIQASIDRGLRSIYKDALDQQAPGFKKATSIIGEGYQATKSPLRKFAVGAAKTGTGLGLSYAGFDAIRHMFGL